MPTIYSLNYNSVENVKKETNLENLNKFKDKLEKDIANLAELKEAVNSQIIKLESKE